MSDIEIILPTSIDKYPGYIWLSDNGKYRAYFTPVGSKRGNSKRFDTYNEAFEYLQFMSLCEGNVRVKNIIYADNTNGYSVALTGGKSMRFSEIDLSLVHEHIWFSHNKGYVCRYKKKGDESTLFHTCMMGKAKDGYEFIHLNKDKGDNRRENVCLAKSARFKRDIVMT